MNEIFHLAKLELDRITESAKIKFVHWDEKRPLFQKIFRILSPHSQFYKSRENDVNIVN